MAIFYSTSEVQQLREHIQRRVVLSQEESDALVKAFKFKRVKKKQDIIIPDFIATVRNYVVRGAFRSFVIGPDGAEHTIQFAVDDWWISDINSFIYQKPATMFVEALEDSAVFQLDYESEAQLKARYHGIETFFRIVAERTAAFHQRRIITNLTMSAEERYQVFAASYPTIILRVPQYALASYLGMTTQTLSKVRKLNAHKKLI